MDDSTESRSTYRNWTVPACWGWSTTRELDQSCVDGLAMLTGWQSGRCAICGMAERPLVQDHDHKTGLLRGLLCTPCNSKEGQVWTLDVEAFNLYRDRPPCVILGLEIVYRGSGMAAEEFRAPVIDLLPISSECTLTELRKMCLVRQSDVARIMGTNQSRVSAIENAGDSMVTSTLAAYLGALGARLRIEVAFDDGVIARIQ